MRVLGIDCGTTCTGYGVIETDGHTYRVLACGAIRAAPGLTLAQRLKRIHQQVAKLLQHFRPDAVALEEVFQASNVKSALQLSQVHGVVLLVAARANLPVCEYSAPTVKKSVVGYGSAEKHQVQHMVQRVLALSKAPKPLDAADALAVALCHIHHSESRRRRLAALKK